MRSPANNPSARAFCVFVYMPASALHTHLLATEAVPGICKVVQCCQHLLPQQLAGIRDKSSAAAAANTACSEQNGALHGEAAVWQPFAKHMERIAGTQVRGPHMPISL